MVKQRHGAELDRKSVTCTQCDRRLNARPSASLTAQTMIGEIDLKRPYFYCRSCRFGTSPLDEVLDLGMVQIQLDIQQAEADLVTEVPHETVSTEFGRSSGIDMSSERIHTLTNQRGGGGRPQHVGCCFVS